MAAVNALSHKLPFTISPFSHILINSNSPIDLPSYSGFLISSKRKGSIISHSFCFCSSASDKWAAASCKSSHCLEWVNLLMSFMFPSAKEFTVFSISLAGFCISLIDSVKAGNFRGLYISVINSASWLFNCLMLSNASLFSSGAMSSLPSCTSCANVSGSCRSCPAAILFPFLYRLSIICFACSYSSGCSFLYCSIQ